MTGIDGTKRASEVTGSNSRYIQPNYRRQEKLVNIDSISNNNSQKSPFYKTIVDFFKTLFERITVFFQNKFSKFKNEDSQNPNNLAGTEGSAELGNQDETSGRRDSANSVGPGRSSEVYVERFASSQKMEEEQP